MENRDTCPHCGQSVTTYQGEMLWDHTFFSPHQHNKQPCPGSYKPTKAQPIPDQGETPVAIEFRPAN